MPSTTRFGFPYPALTDPPNGPTQIGALATSVDTALGTLTDATAANFAALAASGEWTLGANLNIGTPTLINNWTAVGTPSGITHSAGTFTVATAGVYAISFGWRCSASVSGGIYAFVSTSSASSGAGTILFKNSTVSSANVGVSGLHRFSAGGTFFCYAYSATASQAVHETTGDLVTGVTAYRVGN